jgi:phosphatidylinositol glycan class Z
MGTYHQGGIVPTQAWLSQRADATHAIWWKTYSPPIWLLDGKNEFLKTHDLMGMKGELMIRELEILATCDTWSSTKSQNGTYLIAPLSATFLDNYVSNQTNLRLDKVWQYRQHLNMDDLDFGDDGVWPTLSRVVGRRGLAAWRVTKDCIR